MANRGDDTMRVIGSLALAVLLAISFAYAASEYGSKAEAVSMVKRGQEAFKKEGAQATFKSVSDKSTPAFHDLDLYPFLYDLSGVCVPHAARSALLVNKL